MLSTVLWNRLVQYRSKKGGNRLLAPLFSSLTLEFGRFRDLCHLTGDPVDRTADQNNTNLRVARIDLRGRKSRLCAESVLAKSEAMRREVRICDPRAPMVVADHGQSVKKRAMRVSGEISWKVTVQRPSGGPKLSPSFNLRLSPASMMSTK